MGRKERIKDFGRNAGYWAVKTRSHKLFTRIESIKSPGSEQ
jgi:hypothetical protein